jgi:hypothetical protein
MNAPGSLPFVFFATGSPAVADRRFCSIFFIDHAPSPSFLPPLPKIFFFVASAHDLFVRQLYRAEPFFPAIENCGGVCEEETSKEKHHKKR